MTLFLHDKILCKTEVSKAYKVERLSCFSHSIELLFKLTKVIIITIMNVLIYETCATKSEKVPGTAFLDDRGVGEENIDSNLKKAAGKNIILSPQPSDQPDDPLNWSKKIKTLYFIGILLTSVGPAIMGPLLVPGFQRVVFNFRCTSNYCGPVKRRFGYVLGSEFVLM